MAKINVTEFIESLKEMSVLELNDLVKAIEEEFGVTAAAPVAVVAGAAEAAQEGPSAFNVTIAEVGPNKINVIKVVRELTGLGLKEAKDIVDAAPSVVKEQVAEEEANKMKAALEEAGAKVELK